MNKQESPDKMGKTAAFQIDKDSQTVSTLGGYQLMENGNRVYTYSNKPSATDVGAAPAGFGLGGEGAHWGDKSCDDINASGFYAIYSSTTGTPYSGGGPSGSQLIHTRWGSGAGASQMFFAYTSDRVHYRRKYQGVWGSWYELYHTGKKPTPADIGALNKAGDTTSGELSLGAPMILGKNLIKGDNNGVVIRDHGNGNVTISASVGTTGTAGTLYLGYNAALAGTAGYNTKDVRLESPMNWKATHTVIDSNGLLNSEILTGPIRTEKDAGGIMHTVVGGTDTVNRGRTIVVAGECGKVIADNTTTGAETLHLAGDGSDGVYIHTGVQSGWGTNTHQRYQFKNGDIYSQQMDGTKINRFYHNGYKPTAADIGAIATTDSESSGGKVMRVGGPRDNQIAQALANTTGGAYVSSDAPANPFLGMRWFDTTDGRTYIWIIDEDSSQWVEENPQSPDAISYSDRVNNFANTGNVSANKVTAEDNYALVSAARQYQGVYMGKTDGDRRTIIGGGGSVVGDKTGTVYVRPNGITDVDGQAVFSANGDLAIGGTLTGKVVLKAGEPNAMKVNNKATISYQDGAGSMFHNFAQLNGMVWATGNVGDHTLMTLASNGILKTEGAIYGKVGVIARNRFDTNWISIETPEDGAPYIATKTTEEAENRVALRFGKSEISVESDKKLSAKAIRVANDGGLQFAPTADLSGHHWGMGIHPTSRNLAIHRYQNGVWQQSPMEFSKEGAIFCNANVYSTGSINSTGGYLSATRAANPMLELHSPGNYAGAIYLPGAGRMRFSQSNGAGGEAAMYAEFQNQFAHFVGSVRPDVRSASWGQWGSAVGGLQDNTGNRTINPGQWHPLVTSASYVDPTQGYACRWSMGYYRPSAQHNGEVVINMNGDGSIRNNLRLVMSGAGGGGIRMDGTDAGQTWAIQEGGFLYGSSFGAYANMVNWCTASFAPASDSKLKMNIEPATKSALEDVAKIQFKSYEWNENTKMANMEPTKIGLIAQEMEAIDPCYTRDIETFNPDGSVDTSVKALDVTNMLALALKAIQELQEEVAALKAAQ